jgi:hypothetical protein
MFRATGYEREFANGIAGSKPRWQSHPFAVPHLPRQHEIPDSETALRRSDIEVLYDGLPEPIDLELDLENRILYCTDRGDLPRGNSVSRAPIDGKPQTPELLVTHLMEGAGIALDVPRDRKFITDFAGSIYSANIDGSNETKLSLLAGQPHRHRVHRNLKF